MGQSRDNDTWTLRPGDLPASRLLEAEPRLRGLENNPYFRLIARAGHANPKIERVIERLFPFFLLGAMAASPIPAVIGFAKLDHSLYTIGYFVIAFLCVLAVVGFHVTPNPGGNKAPVSERDLFDLISFELIRSKPFGLNRDILLQLAMCGFPAEDFALGMWGGAVREKMRRSQRWITWPAWCVWAILFTIGSWGLRPLSLLPLTVFAYLAVVARADPYAALAVTASFARTHLRAQQSLPRLLLRISGFVFAVLALFVFLSWLAEPSLANFFARGHGWIPPNRIYSILNSPLSGAGAAALGAFLGRAHGAYLRRNASRILRRIESDIAMTIQIWLAREGERASSPGKV